MKFRKERGRLVPYSAWDQERLDSYRDGAVITAHITQEKSRPLERKYWAILHEVIDKCGLKIRTAENLHKAIRFGVGAIDVFEDADGNLQGDLRSTTKMQEPDYRQYFDDAMVFLQKLTGVDPLTLRLESADVGDDEPPASPADESGDAAAPPSTVAASDPQEGGSSEEGDNPGSVATEQPAPSSESSVLPIKRVLMEECVDNMLRDAFSEPADQQAAKVEKLRGIFLERQNLGDHAKFVNLCAETVLRIVGKPSEKARARDYLMTKIPAAARDEAPREVRP